MGHEAGQVLAVWQWEMREGQGPARSPVHHCRPAHLLEPADLRIVKLGLPACACSASNSSENSSRLTLPLPSALGNAETAGRLA